MASLNLLDLLVFGLVIFLVILIAQRGKKRNAPFPPGPPGKPIIGNALDFDPLSAWTKFTEWKETYGPSSCFWSQWFSDLVSILQVTWSD